jgi:hypothetical protein
MENLQNTQARKYLLCVLLVIFFTERHVNCSFINFNKYVDIFPPTYFVKIYFDKIMYENLGPSNAPLALIQYNSSKPFSYYNQLKCQFLHSQQPMRRSRTDHMVNLIAIGVQSCVLTGSDGNCGVLGMIYGRILSSNYNCMGHENPAFTILLVDSQEKDFILSDPEYTWYLFYNELNPRYILVFDSKDTEEEKSVCTFKYEGTTIAPLCQRTTAVSIKDFTEILNFQTEWYTGNVFITSGQIMSEIGSAWSLYFERNIHQVLVTEMLKRTNETGGHPHVFNRGSIERKLWWHDFSYSMQNTLLDTTRLKFISCYVKKETISFKSYVKSFDGEVWISLLSVCLFISVTVFLYNRHSKLKTSFNPLFFFISTLLEEPYSVPSSLWNSGIFKAISMPWILTAVVFTNLYIGLMISDITAPLQSERVDSFYQVFKLGEDDIKYLRSTPRQLVLFWKTNFTFSNGTTKRILKSEPPCDEVFDARGYELHHSKFQDKEAFALLQRPVETCHSQDRSILVQKRFFSHPWMYNEFEALNKELFNYDRFGKDNDYLLRLKAFFLPRNRYHPKLPPFPSSNVGTSIPLYLSAAIENELATCTKSIFIGDSKDLQSELLYLQNSYPRKGFYMSNDTFERRSSRPVIWMFRNSAQSKAQRYLRLLIEAGMRNGILSLKSHKFYVMRSIGTKIIKETESTNESMGITGSIQTIFFILLANLSAATLVFMLEMMYSYLPRVFPKPNNNPANTFEAPFQG